MSALTMWKIMGTLVLLVLGISGNTTGFAVLIAVAMYKFVYLSVKVANQVSVGRDIRRQAGF